MIDLAPTRQAIMKFWVRWDFFIGIGLCGPIGYTFIPSIADGLTATAIWIVLGWITVGGCMLIGYGLRRRYPDLGRPVEAEDILRKRNRDHHYPPPDK